MTRRRLLAGAALALAAATAARAKDRNDDWSEVASPHYTVVGDARPSDLRAIALRFEELRLVLGQAMPKARLDSPRPLTIYAPRDEASMRSLLPMYWEEKDAARPAGVFLWDNFRVFAVVRADLREAESYGHSVIFHEYIHFLNSLNFRELPVWLGEGLAEYYASATFDSDEVIVGRPAVWHIESLRAGAFIPLETFFAIDHESLEYRRHDRAGTFYGQSWAAVHYLLSDKTGERGRRLSDFMRRIAEGVPSLDAAKAAFGDLAILDKELQGYIRRFQFMGRKLALSGVPAQESFATRPLSRAEALSLQAQLHLGAGRWTEARATGAESVRLDAARAAPRSTLALLDMREQRLAEAQIAAQQAVDVEPAAYLAQAVLGTVARAAGDAGVAETALRASARLNGAYAPTWIQLAAVLAETSPLSEETLQAGQRAIALDGTNPEAWLVFAEVLIRRGEREPARKAAQEGLKAADTPSQRAALTHFLEELDDRMPDDPAAQVRFFVFQCQRGNGQACNDAGIRYFKGEGTPVDFAAAASYYERACAKEVAWGCHNLGVLRRDGRGGVSSHTEAFALFDKSCTLGLPEGCDSLGRALHRGEGTAVDAPRALALFSAACDKGLVYSCTYLGYMLDEGRHVARDARRAATLYERGCAADDPDACLLLGRLLRKGAAGVPADRPRAVALLESACARGRQDACYDIGALHLDASPPNPAAAADAWKRACASGSSAACAGLGGLYVTGRGVSRDLKQARDHFASACGAGYEPACRSLVEVERLKKRP
jgi:TPR repeat protein